MVAELIFDREEDDRLTDAAIAQVAEATNDMWLEAAYAVAMTCAETMATFTTDDIWKVLAESDAASDEHRAMGAVMRRVKREKIADPTSMYRAMDRPEGHRKSKRVWRSRLYVKRWAA